MEKGKSMQRRGTLLGLCLMLLLMGVQRSSVCLASQESPHGILRLHVLANSDSKEDQQTKLLVRDALLPLFAPCQSYEEARNFLLTHGKEVQRVCEETLKSRGADYGVRLLLGETAFPDRLYGDTLYPAGVYDALCVELGAAKGHNWWCVLFPPLCIVTEEGEPVNLEEAAFESDILAFLKTHFGRWFA